MTGRELIQILYEHVTFPPGIASKRFVRDMAAHHADYVLSERAEAYAWRIAYIYRRQLPRNLAEEAVRRKTAHKWEMEDGKGRCAVCRNWLFSPRQTNSPCSGPPPPPKEKRRKAAAKQATDDGCLEHQASIEFGENA